MSVGPEVMQASIKLAGVFLAMTIINRRLDRVEEHLKRVCDELRAGIRGKRQS